MQQGLLLSKNIVKETLEIKEMFPNLSSNKIKQVQKVINGANSKSKPRIAMTTKGLSRKQVIIPMSNDIAKKFIKELNSHIANINCALKAIKSSILADFIHVEDKGIVVTTNNIVSGSDFQEIEKYVKNSLSTDADEVSLTRLPQSKSYLKIMSIPYISKKTNSCIALDEIEDILKNNHIFNNIVLTLKSCIIKVSPKSDIAIIWIDIWDTQTGQNAKTIINHQFNIGRYITMIQGANMNPGVLQYKNCWKWGHMAGVCCIQGAKCVRCNGPHLSEHHHHFAWCCKAKNKINPPRLETKKGEPCSHSFKCLNCKGKHQANSGSIVSTNNGT